MAIEDGKRVDSSDKNQHLQPRQTENAAQNPSMLIMTYHSDGPDRHNAVTPVAVGPGVPAGILSLLQNEHLTSHVLLLISHPARETDRQVFCL